MSLLEVEDVGESAPQGVVMVLVGSEHDSSREHEPVRSLRMYNLSSLISLAKWAVAQKVPAASDRSERILTTGIRVRAHWIYVAHPILISRHHRARRESHPEAWRKA